MERRPATAEEAKALAHPLRLRILRLCLHESLTNKQIADALEKDPGTVLHHVRTLVDTGFLAAEDVRPGAKGALEKPYRATGKSWTVDVTDQFDPTAVILAGLDAFREEVLEAGGEAFATQFRLAVRLSQGDADELKARLSALGDEVAERDDPSGESYGIYVGMHRRPVREPRRGRRSA